MCFGYNSDVFISLLVVSAAWSPALTQEPAAEMLSPRVSDQLPDLFDPRNGCRGQEFGMRCTREKTIRVEWNPLVITRHSLSIVCTACKTTLTVGI